MYCPKCGQQNPDEAKFCGKCGATITAAAAPPPPQSFHAAPGATGDAGGTGAVSQGLKIGMIIVSIIVAIAGIVVGIVFMLDANPEKKKAGKLWLIIGSISLVVQAILFSE